MKTTQNEIRNRVYDALAEIIFETGADQEDMEKALDWFQDRFFGDSLDSEYYG